MGALKNSQKFKDNLYWIKMYFTLQLMIHLAEQSRGAPKYTFRHKDAQQSAFEVAHKGALEVALELHLWLHLLMQSLIHKCE